MLVAWWTNLSLNGNHSHGRSYCLLGFQSFALRTCTQNGSNSMSTKWRGSVHLLSREQPRGIVGRRVWCVSVRCTSTDMLWTDTEHYTMETGDHGRAPPLGRPHGRFMSTGVFKGPSRGRVGRGRGETTKGLQRLSISSGFFSVALLFQSSTLRSREVVLPCA